MDQLQFVDVRVVDDLPVLTLEDTMQDRREMITRELHVSELLVNIIKLDSVRQHHEIQLNKDSWYGAGSVVCIDDIDYTRQDADYESDHTRSDETDHTRSEESSDVIGDVIVPEVDDARVDVGVQTVEEVIQEETIETVECEEIKAEVAPEIHRELSPEIEEDEEEVEEEEEDEEEEEELSPAIEEELTAGVSGELSHEILDTARELSPEPLVPLVPLSPLPPMWLRTVLFIKKVTVPGQDLFIRGGLSAPHITVDDKNNNVRKDGSITIQYESLGTTPHYNKYNSWRQGVTKLDWYGREDGQGTFEGMPAVGAPGAWTSNKTDVVEYQPLNTFGEHYWMIDFLIDYTQTNKGWFEFRCFLTNGDGWESDIHQDSLCTGTAGGSTPYVSTNHMARCGYMNVFEFNSASCQIDEL